MASHVLAIDAGTTGVRAVMVDGNGAIVSRAYHEFPQHFPRPGWVEHDPEDWWAATVRSCSEALAGAGLTVSDVAAVGMTNQRETAVVWDRRTLAPVHRAIVWQDRRTAEACRRLVDRGWEDRIKARTGLVVDAYFSGTKVAWILDHVAGARRDAEAGHLAFGTVDSYLIARLTAGAEHVTDRTNASRTMVFDIHRLDWDDELLDELRIPRSMLPDVRPSASAFGHTEPDAFLGASLPVCGVAGDQQAALFGEACFDPGTTKNTYGTGSFVLMNVGGGAPPSAHGLLTTMAAGADDRPRYALEGAIFVTGAVIQWLRDGLKVIERADEAGPLAASVPDTAGVAFVPALTGLGAPWWDPDARGTIVGITRGTTRAHIVRAAVESIAFQTRAVADAMRADAGLPLTELKADGGASAMDLMLQLQADVLGIPVRRAAVQETTVLGAAWLAGLQAGLWASEAELAARWRLDREFLPSDPEVAEARYHAWSRAVDRARGWAAGDPDEPRD